MINYIDNLEYEHFPDEIKDVCDFIGIENTRKLWKVFRGEKVGFPAKAPQSYCIEYIRDNFNGNNKSKILAYLEISHSQFYRLSRKL